MRIVNPSADEHAGFRALVDAEIRPGRAKTHAWDDFPLVLDPDNIPWTIVAVDPEAGMVAGLAALVREFTTNCGRIQVAGLGSVVTHPEHRGRGLSRALQDEMLARLRRHDVPLAVLWTDQPEIYSGRGFISAGWEHHVDLDGADLPEPGEVRDFVAADTEAVAALYRQHAWRTVRSVGDDARLYGMPGTRGRVVPGPDGIPVAAVFCGKGADFPDYVTEWSGPVPQVMRLLAAVRRRGWASRVLAPPGSEALVDALTGCGGSWLAVPSGQWCVLDADQLRTAVSAAGMDPPGDADPGSWLGRVDDDGLPCPGVLHLAVWGFDSV